MIFHFKHLCACQIFGHQKRVTKFIKMDLFRKKSWIKSVPKNVSLSKLVTGHATKSATHWLACGMVTTVMVLHLRATRSMDHRIKIDHWPAIKEPPETFYVVHGPWIPAKDKRSTFYQSVDFVNVLFERTLTEESERNWLPHVPFMFDIEIVQGKVEHLNKNNDFELKYSLLFYIV